MKETTFIYCLICPVDGLLRYVGKANNPAKRLKDHCLDFRCMDGNKASWILTLRRRGLKPEMMIVDEVEIFDWKFWEEALKSRALANRAAGEREKELNNVFRELGFR